MQYYNMSSFVETKLPNLIKKNTFGAMVKHNTKFLTRAYPSRTRISSSNYSPFEFWMCGFHLVALNYQKSGIIYHCNIVDQGLRLNKAMFGHDKKGYRLKPSYLLEGNYENTIKNLVKQSFYYKIDIEVINFNN